MAAQRAGAQAGDAAGRRGGRAGARRSSPAPPASRPARPSTAARPPRRGRRSGRPLRHRSERLPQRLHLRRSPASSQDLGVSLLVSTYQSGRLIVGAGRRRQPQHPLPRLPEPDGHRRRRRPAWPSAPSATSGSSATSPRSAGKLAAGGKHDACFLPRTGHVTGDIGVHELAWAGGRAVGRQHPLLLPVHASTPSTASCRAGGRRSSPPWPPRTAATSTAWPSSTAGRATSPRSARPTRRTAGGRTRPAAAC